MKKLSWLFVLVQMLISGVMVQAQAPPAPWIGVHVEASARSLPGLRESIPALGKMGVNAIVLEVDYHFAFASHPELKSDNALTKAQAGELAKLCRGNGIRP